MATAFVFCLCVLPLCSAFASDQTFRSRPAPKPQQSQQALTRAVQLARTVHASGGTFFFKAHPASTAWSDSELQHTLQACGCVLARMPFCGHGLHGAWLIASNKPQTSTLGHICQHPLGTHRQLLKRKHESASSRETVHYPASLAKPCSHSSSTMSPPESSQASPAATASLVGPASVVRPPICDGAGACSPFGTPGSCALSYAVASRLLQRSSCLELIQNRKGVERTASDQKRKIDRAQGRKTQRSSAL